MPENASRPLIDPPRPRINLRCIARGWLTELRRALGRHRTVWRLLLAVVAIVVALSVNQNGPTAAHHEVPTVGTNGLASLPSSSSGLTEGHVGIGIPALGTSPLIGPGAKVDLIGITDPLIVGEVRPTDVLVSAARVLDVGEGVVTVEVARAEAPRVVDALASGSVVLVLSG